MNDLIVIGSQRSDIPAFVAAVGERASTRFLEFSAANIRNPHTREAITRQPVREVAAGIADIRQHVGGLTVVEDRAKSRYSGCGRAVGPVTILIAGSLFYLLESPAFGIGCLTRTSCVARAQAALIIASRTRVPATASGAAGRTDRRENLLGRRL